MFEGIPYRLLVRRVRSGDCDKIGELYRVVEPDLVAFCLSMTEDDVRARRAADGAFVYATELLATQSLTVASFRSTLLGEAKGRCYSEIGRASQMEFSGEVEEDPVELDLARLESRLEQLRPATLDNPDSRLAWRSRMAPSTAITVVLVMVVMIEMAVMGLDLSPNQPVDGGTRSAGIDSNQRGQSESPVSTQARVIRDTARVADDRREKAKADTPTQSESDSERAPVKAPRVENNKAPGARDPGVPLPQLPTVNEHPVLPEVNVEVDAGPIEVNVKSEDEAGILPQASACVTTTCITTP